MSIYVKLVTALLVAGILYAGYWSIKQRGVIQGRAEVQELWAAETKARTAAESAAILTRVKNNERIADQQLIDNRRITKAHNEEIIRVRGDIARAPGLRVGAALCSGFASGTETDRTGSSDGANPTGRLLSAEMDRDIKTLIFETEAIAAAGRACQGFVVANGMAP